MRTRAAAGLETVTIIKAIVGPATLKPKDVAELKIYELNLMDQQAYTD